jgi:hypothetical protein
VQRGVVVVLIGAVALASAQSAVAISEPSISARAPALYKNCTNFNKRYPHGVGKLTARDKTSGTPVTNFRRSTRIYNIAMRWNRGLDRDKDGIACEKA